MKNSDDIQKTNEDEYYNKSSEFKSDDIVIRQRKFSAYNGQLTNYKKMGDINQIHAFVVNMRDTLNFDLDISLPTNLRSKYNEVHKNVYTYMTYDTDTLEESDIKKGITYRCHLRGIEFKNRKNKNGNFNTGRREVEELIMKNNRNIKCNIGDIDIYKRLLVDIIIITDDGMKLNLTEHLLMKYKDVYVEYS